MDDVLQWFFVFSIVNLRFFLNGNGDIQKFRMDETLLIRLPT